MKAPPTQSTKTPTGPETHRSVRVNINPRAPRSPPSVHTYSGSVSGGGGAARRGAAARCGSASVCRISCSSPTRRHITHITSPPVSSAEGGGGGSPRTDGGSGEGLLAWFGTRRKKTAQTRRPPFKARRASTVAQPPGSAWRKEDDGR